MNCDVPKLVEGPVPFDSSHELDDGRLTVTAELLLDTQGRRLGMIRGRR